MKKGRSLLILVLILISASCKPRPQKTETPEPGGACSEIQNQPGSVDKVLASPGEDPAPGDWLVRAMMDEPGTLNPVTATDIYAELVDSLVMESLLELDIDTQELKPLLAQTWEISPDKLTYTFHLRKDVRWQDGKPFTADDVIYTLQKIMDPKVDAAHSRIYYIDCIEYKKLDDYTVFFRWRQPYFKALEILGTSPMLIVPKHILDDNTDFNKHPFGRNIVGTGPYKFVKWETGKRIELVRNENYWGKKPYPDRIVFKIITNEDVALQAFKQGEIDTVSLTPTQWTKQTNYPEFYQKANKIAYDYPQFGYIGWNLRRAPFDDKRVRTAMTLLLNREAILKNIMFCMGKVVSGPFYINTPYYDQTIKPLPYDPEQAKKILDQAGWSDHNGDGVRDQDGKDFRFEFLMPSGNQDTEKIATIYKEDLAKAGIIMEIRQLEWAVFLQNIQDHKFDASTLGWAMDFDTDPYQIWHSSMADVKGSSNHVGYKNPEVDQLIEQGRVEFDRNKRALIYHQIHKIIAQDQPYTFLFTPKARIAVNKRFRNVVPYTLRPIFKFTDWFVPLPLQKYSEDKK